MFLYLLVSINSSLSYKIRTLYERLDIPKQDISKNRLIFKLKMYKLCITKSKLFLRITRFMPYSLEMCIISFFSLLT